MAKPSWSLYIYIRQALAEIAETVNGITELTDSQSVELQKAAAIEATVYLADEQHLLGQVFLEDLESGRAPSVADFVEREHYEVVSVLPSEIKETPNIPRLGKLLLRSPLPAVIIASEPPPENSPLIRVADTSALGIDLPIYLLFQGVQQIAEDSFLLVGVLQIPIRDDSMSKAWSFIIPNAARFRRAFVAPDTPAGPLRVDVTW